MTSGRTSNGARTSAGCRNSSGSKRAALALGALIFLLLFAGCPQWGDDGQPSDNGNGEVTDGEQPGDDEPAGDQQDGEGEDDRPGEALSVVAYYADATATFVVPILHETELDPGADTAEAAEAAMQKLIAGPPERVADRLTRTIPEGTAVRSASLDGGTLTVDFSEELTSYGGGSTYEIMLQSTVLSTAGMLPEVEEVQFKIGGGVRPYLPEGSAVDAPLPVQKHPNLQTGADVPVITVWQRTTGGLWAPFSIDARPDWRRAAVNYFSGERRSRLQSNPLAGGVLNEIETEPNVQTTPELTARSPDTFERVTFHLSSAIGEMTSTERDRALTALVATFGAEDYRVTVAGERDGDLSERAGELRDAKGWLN